MACADGRGAGGGRRRGGRTSSYAGAEEETGGTKPSIGGRSGEEEPIQTRQRRCILQRVRPYQPPQRSGSSEGGRECVERCSRSLSNDALAAPSSSSSQAAAEVGNRSPRDVPPHLLSSSQASPTKRVCVHQRVPHPTIQWPSDLHSSAAAAFSRRCLPKMTGAMGGLMPPCRVECLDVQCRTAT